MRINNINELDRDAFALILEWLSPRDWNSASKVCRLWNERAHQNNVRQAVSQNFFPWLVERCREDFRAVEDFINTKELIDFLMRKDIPIVAKISELNNLKASFLEKEKINLFFPKTLSKKFLPHGKNEPLNPLLEFIDRLNSFLVHAFRLSMDRNETNIIGKFNEALSQFYLEKTPENFHEFLPEELSTLLAGDNSQNNVPQLSNLRELATRVRPQYLHSYSEIIAVIPNFKRKAVLVLILIALSIASLAAGGYLLGSIDGGSSAASNSNFPYFFGGLCLLIPGALGGLLLIGAGFFSLVSYVSARNEAIQFLNHNTNTDTIIEIPPEATERTPLIPSNRRQDNIENNNNAPVVEEASAGTVSEVEMQTDDGERRFSMN